MRLKGAIAVVAMAATISGCATILNDDTQQVNVATSTGKPASGTVNGQAFQAPGIVTLTRKKANAVFTTDTPGCAKETVALNSVDPKFFINILSGGVFGSTTDYVSEEMWKYEDRIVITCQP